MTPEILAAVAALGVVAALIFARRVSGGAGDLSSEQLPVKTVRSFAESEIRAQGFRVDPATVVRIAWIESSNRARSAGAVRFDPSAVGDDGRSLGLMQTQLTTAQDLAGNFGYTTFGFPMRADLFGPQASVYFSAAYLDWLSHYGGQRRSEEWIVRSYNGGPGHRTASTNGYWRLYREAEGILG